MLSKREMRKLIHKSEFGIYFFECGTKWTNIYRNGKKICTTDIPNEADITNYIAWWKKVRPELDEPDFQKAIYLYLLEGII